MASHGSEHEREKLVEELQKSMRRRQRQAQAAIITVLTAFAAALSYFVLARDGIFASAIGPLLYLAIGLAVLGAALLIYLQGPSRTAAHDEADSYRQTDFLKTVQDLYHRVVELEEQSGQFEPTAKAQRSPLTDEERRELVNALSERIQKTASDQLLAQLRNDIERDRASRHVHRRTETTTHRLHQAIADLSRRGNLNLVLGILTTLVGLGLLAWTVFMNPLQATSPAALLAHYLPRITLVILIEVFAYFFLSLYRRSLTDIKYFQNELTTIEQRSLGLNVAEELGGVDTLNPILLSLVSTDRNASRSAGATSGVDASTDHGVRARDFVGILKDSQRNT